ncbi:NADH-ubiquinone oxidoreductase subunit NDUFA12 family protein, partial [Vibrio parahaemolyticus]
GHPYAGRERRWVIYNGANDASRVPAEWHGWLHGNFDGVPESNLPAPRVWEVDYTPNATGTSQAYRPQGAL